MSHGLQGQAEHGNTVLSRRGSVAGQDLLILGQYLEPHLSQSWLVGLFIY